MEDWTEANDFDHEELLIESDRESGLRVVIAIHDTTLGPPVGGTRMRPYASLGAAIADALRLSRAMTYKAALAEIECGGAKAVIPADPIREKTPKLLQGYARILNRVDRFHTGGDMGIDSEDVTELVRWTSHISQVPAGAKIDAAGLTAIGVRESIHTVAATLGLPMDRLRIALQGLGQVGLPLARGLAREGVRLTVSDTQPERLRALAAEVRAEIVEPSAIYDVECDIFSPNAGGGILDDRTLARLRCAAVVGAANDQLAESRHGDELFRRGILFAPDYVVNAGGLLSLLFERGETDEAGIVARVEKIGARLAAILDRSRRENAPPFRVADRMVEEKLAATVSARSPRR